MDNRLGTIANDGPCGSHLESKLHLLVAGARKQDDKGYHDIAAAAAEFIVVMTAVVKMRTVVSALAVVAPLLLPSWWCM